MPQGWIRAWREDRNIYFAVKNSAGKRAAKRAQAEFRRDFRTSLRDAPDDGASELTELAWGDTVSLPDGLSNDDFTGAQAGGETGFIKTAHLIELAFVDRIRPQSRELRPDDFKADLEFTSGNGGADLLWGDPVQIMERRGDKAFARARGLTGEIDLDRLTDEALLEIYMIDVGQGDGVLIRFPNGAHMMIDGGLARDKQMTGKNAADFVDWKFFGDYGDWRVKLDWMVASHSDADHYGGLHDLVDMDAVAREELDCLDVRIDKFGHPGLSRFSGSIDSEGLGPRDSVDGRDVFTRLLGDRADAQALIDGTGPDGLKMSGWWRDFVKAVLERHDETDFEFIALDKDEARAGSLPDLPAEGGCAIKVLGPAFIDNNGAPVLPDLNTQKKKSINTNGHSVCLRLDYGKARILMTGDLNTASMEWLRECFGDHMDEWACDVAKACHHGSHDVSFKFLESINAGATIISSGDNEGHAHPRPEIVSASALSGHKTLSADQDRVITPLVYMTEIERSVLLGEINRIEINNLGEAGKNATVLGKPAAEFSGSEYLTAADWKAIDDLGDDADSAEVKAIKDAAKTREKPRIEALEATEQQARTSATIFARRPAGVVDIEYPRERLRRARVMEKNVYGLVNVRTDGETIMCATKRDDGERWLIHHFNARF